MGGSEAGRAKGGANRWKDVPAEERSKQMSEVSKQVKNRHHPTPEQAKKAASIRWEKHNAEKEKDSSSDS